MNAPQAGAAQQDFPIGNIRSPIAVPIYEAQIRGNTSIALRGQGDGSAPLAGFMISFKICGVLFLLPGIVAVRRFSWLCCLTFREAEFLYEDFAGEKMAAARQVIITIMLPRHAPARTSSGK